MQSTVSNAVKIKLLLCILLLAEPAMIDAQHPPEKKDIPPFHILLTNLKHFHAGEMEKNINVLLVYFDPVCEHCQTFTKLLITNMEKLKNIKIIMISYQPLSIIQKFETDYKLKHFSNIKVGTEGYSLIVQGYYNISHFPFVALFGKNGKLIKSYKTAPAINELISTVKQSG